MGLKIRMTQDNRVKYTYELDSMDCYSYRQVPTFEEFSRQQRLKAYRDAISVHRGIVQNRMRKLAKELLRNPADFNLSSEIARLSEIDQKLERIQSENV